MEISLNRKCDQQRDLWETMQYIMSRIPELQLEGQWQAASRAISPTPSPTPRIKHDFLLVRLPKSVKRLDVCTTRTTMEADIYAKPAKDWKHYSIP
jgi:hypothetical protein